MFYIGVHRPHEVCSSESYEVVTDDEAMCFA